MSLCLTSFHARALPAGHPNLVKFIGVAVKQRPWLVLLEFCPYGDLSDVLRACERKQIKLELKERLRIAQQLADGMAFMASKRSVPAWACFISASNSARRLLGSDFVDSRSRGFRIWKTSS